MTDIPRLEPIPGPVNQEYYDGLKRHELPLQKCRACDKFRFWPTGRNRRPTSEAFCTGSYHIRGSFNWGALCGIGKSEWRISHGQAT